MAGEHSAHHVGALASQLPPDSRLRGQAGEDEPWTMQNILLATLCNQLSAWMWAMGDKRRRGPKPQPIGPSWMRKRERRLESRVLTVRELENELRRPRRNA